MEKPKPNHAPPAHGVGTAQHHASACGRVRKNKTTGKKTPESFVFVECRETPLNTKARRGGGREPNPCAIILLLLKILLLNKRQLPLPPRRHTLRRSFVKKQSWFVTGHVRTPLGDDNSSAVTRRSGSEDPLWRPAGQLLPWCRGIALSLLLASACGGHQGVCSPHALAECRFERW